MAIRTGEPMASTQQDPNLVAVEVKIDAHIHLLLDQEDFVSERLCVMDEAGVEASVVLALPHLRFMDSTCGNNEDVARIVAAHPDRFIGGIYVDPRESRWRETLDRYSDAGFRCVKMWPPAGFLPDDPAFLPVFEHIATLGLPIVFHTGLTAMGANTQSKCADPMHVEALLRRFPETSFVLSHWGGLATFATSWALMKANPNVYLDSSARAWSWPGTGLYRLHAEVTPIDFDRILWGTDNFESPAAAVVIDHLLLEELGQTNHAGAFFGGTVRRLLRLNPGGSREPASARGSA